MTDYKDKGVGYLSKKGQSIRKPVTDERDGSEAGHHVEHWDDRQDAVVKIKPVAIKTRVQGDEN